MSYFSNIGTAFRTLAQGFGLTLRHLFAARHRRQQLGVKQDNYFNQADERGLFTIQYPFEGMPVPVNGRYKLHNEIDDCIVCDKCAKVCPVNCIDIVPIRSAETLGTTSDGTPKRIHAAKFDIDMAKCCFCGLCTTVCPTECLTMTDEYDFSVVDIAQHNFAFGKMNAQEIATAEQAWDQAQAAKAAAQPPTPGGSATPGAKPKPVMPRPKPAGQAKPKVIVPKPKKRDDDASDNTEGQ